MRLRFPLARLFFVFSSGLVDVALRLGPEIGINRSNELKTRHKTQWFNQYYARQINTSPEQENGERRQTTRKSPSQICVSPRKATAKQQKKRGQGLTQNQKHTRFARTQREFPTVSQKHAEKETNCVRPSVTKQTK